MNDLRASQPLIDRNRRWLFAFTNALTVTTALACQVPIESRLSEEQANQILVTLNAASIAANKVPEGGDRRKPSFRVEVASSKAGRALSVLQAAELPKRPEPGWDEIYSETGIIPTVTEERARFAAALSGELSRTIEAIPGVLKARVHIAIPDNRATLLDTPAVRPRASVVVKRQPDSSDSKRHEREKAIQKLVAGAVQDMKSEDVSVIEVATTARVQVSPVLVQIGPITVTRETVGTLRFIAGTLLVSLVVLAIAVIVLFARLRRLSKKVK
jgi:type III secretion protein J